MINKLTLCIDLSRFSSEFVHPTFSITHRQPNSVSFTVPTLLLRQGIFSCDTPQGRCRVICFFKTQFFKNFHKIQSQTLSEKSQCLGLDVDMPRLSIDIIHSIAIARNATSQELPDTNSIQSISPGNLRRTCSKANKVYRTIQTSAQLPCSCFSKPAGARVQATSQ